MMRPKFLQKIDLLLGPRDYVLFYENDDDQIDAAYYYNVETCQSAARLYGGTIYDKWGEIVGY